MLPISCLSATTAPWLESLKPGLHWSFRHLICNVAELAPTVLVRCAISNREEMMAESVYKVIELVGTSTSLGKSSKRSR